MRSSADFNPRSREGSDLKYQSLRVPLPDFNPRSREGSDLVQAYSVGVCCRFQSTLPRGERLAGGIVEEHLVVFQSTLPRGERRKSICSWDSDTKFQSTLPRGERRGTMDQRCTMQQFQSTLPRGERQDASRPVVSIYGISIHAPARGATRRSKYI